MPKILYRPQGTDPKGSTVGGYVIGAVHRNVPDKIAEVMVKNHGFTEVEKDFDPKKAAPTDKKAATAQPLEG
jgi:hypothetical protein